MRDLRSDLTALLTGHGLTVDAADAPWVLVRSAPGLRERLGFFRTDLAERWHALTGQPMVFAVWAARAEVAPRQLESRVDVDTTTLARSYRDRLYQNPQSLAEVVSVNAVRENGELMGYRIVPGVKREQFERLGFKAGDLVRLDILVNGNRVDALSFICRGTPLTLLPKHHGSQA